MNTTVFVPISVKVLVRGEELSVADPALRKVLELLRDAGSIFDRLVSLKTDDGTLGISQMLELISDPQIFKGFVLCASACTNKPAEFFSDITLTETTDLLQAIIEVVDWSKLKELFLKVSQQRTQGLGITS